MELANIGGPRWTRRGWVIAGIGWVGTAIAAAPAVPLARAAPAGMDPAGYLVSEKYDGVRALWDGQTLRFRSGAPIAAPRAFVERLPPVPLDGELWLGRGRFEPLVAAVRRETPRDDEWRAVRYMVFEEPGGAGRFDERCARLAAVADAARWPQLVVAPQAAVDGRAALKRRLDEVVRAGGEGLVLHRADAPYQAGRSDMILKLKPMQDADAVVIGHVPGRGRLQGRLGALRVRAPDGVEFLIGTGYTDAQRTDPPPPGTTVTYTYRGVTAKGVPRFASFLRVRAPEDV